MTCIVGVCMVRDEDDILPRTVDHMLTQGVDRLVIADNGSQHPVADQLAGHGINLGRVEVVDDPEPGYYQDRKMSHLAAQAVLGGADWVVPFDADELWYSPDGRTVADVLSAADADVVAAAEFKHWPTPW